MLPPLVNLLVLFGNPGKHSLPKFGVRIGSHNGHNKNFLVPCASSLAQQCWGVFPQGVHGLILA